MEIVKAIKADLDNIVDFQIKMAKETEEKDLDPSAVRKGVQKILDREDLGFYYVAKEITPDKSKITVASLLVQFEWSDWRNKNVYWIHSVYVVPQFRWQGIFRMMYEKVLDEVHQNKDIGGVRLYVDKRNISAQEVYKKLGMNSDSYYLFEYLKK